jgi:hypothetical protein
MGQIKQFPHTAGIVHKTSSEPRQCAHNGAGFMYKGIAKKKAIILVLAERLYGANQAIPVYRRYWT